MEFRNIPKASIRISIFHAGKPCSKHFHSRAARDCSISVTDRPFVASVIFTEHLIKSVNEYDIFSIIGKQVCHLVTGWAIVRNRYKQGFFSSIDVNDRIVTGCVKQPRFNFLRNSSYIDYYDQTERALLNLEKKISALYGRAAGELQGKINAYFGNLIARDEHQRELLEAGVITKEQYQLWRMAQIGRGERYIVLQDEITKRCNEANVTAMAYVNDTTPGIYSMNYNYSAYTIEKVHGNVGFTLFDEQSVRRLLVDDPEVFPAPRVDIPEDLRWNKNKLRRELISGIMQGESIGQLADRFQSITDMNRSAALRNARTAVTAAQNAGRQESYNRANAMGIQMRKRWRCVKDLRTRRSHGLLDGTVVDADEFFVSELGSKMLYPGDRDHGADPCDLYNCRCGIQSVEKEGIEAEPRMMRVRNPVTGRNELVSEMSYQDWFDWKRSQNPEAFDAAKKKLLNVSSDREQYEKYVDQLGNSVAKTFADFQKMKYNKPEEYNLLKQYARDVRAGWVSPLSGFKNYRELYNRIQTEVVGRTAADGTVITGQVPHFMQRIIGTMVDPQKLKDELKVIRRSGVDVNAIIDAVFNPVEIGAVQVRKSGKRSVKLIGKKCAVTINPDTGELIQTNPL